MSNDSKNYPEDSFENMIKFADYNNFGNINYLIDKTQTQKNMEQYVRLIFWLQ